MMKGNFAWTKGFKRTERGLQGRCTGCMSCEWQSTIGNSASALTLVFGPNNPDRILSYLDPHRYSSLPTLSHNNPSRQRSDSTMDLYPDPPPSTQRRHTTIFPPKRSKVTSSITRTVTSRSVLVGGSSQSSSCTHLMLREKSRELYIYIVCMLGFDARIVSFSG